MNKILVILILIFALALIIRFLYFPNNIYFGFDQARDAFAASDVLKGDLKIVGPPTTFEGLNHGVLYYYIWAPIYLLGQGDPTFLAAFLRTVNAALIFLVFLIGSTIFNRKVGLFAVLLFAVSFEQTQFAIYMNHPSLGVLSVLLLYWGLSLLVFQKKNYGLIIASAALALSVQFEFVLVYLMAPSLTILLMFRNHLPKIDFHIWRWAILSFLLIISTFILSEIKFHFKAINAATALLGNSQKGVEAIISTYIFEIKKMIAYNFVGNSNLEGTGMLILIVSSVYIFYKFRNLRKGVLFIGVWFFSSFLIYLISGGSKDLNSNIPLFYHNMGVSVSLIILTAMLIDLIYKKVKILAILTLIVIIFMNWFLIQELNPKGSISEINVQSGMLLSDEKKVMDYMYNESKGKPFAVKGITMPFLINTTWSYLFKWYGMEKYGYLPVWNGKHADGFPGALRVQEAQEGLPVNRFLVIEPVRGIAPYLINEYLQEENYFTKVVEEKKFGEFIVQKRKKF